MEASDIAKDGLELLDLDDPPASITSVTEIILKLQQFS